MDGTEKEFNPKGLSLLALLAGEGRDIAEAITLDGEVESRLGLKLIEGSKERVVVSMPVAPAAFNGLGNLHGGAIATLVDVSAGLAATLGSGFRPGLETIVTADLHVRYLGRAKGSVVIAESHVLRAGKMLIVVECAVRDDLGHLIAVADFSSMIVPRRDALPGAASAGPTLPDL